MLAATIPLFASWIVLHFADNVVSLYATQIIFGLSIGLVKIFHWMSQKSLISYSFILCIVYGSEEFSVKDGWNAIPGRVKLDAVTQLHITRAMSPSAVLRTSCIHTIELKISSSGLTCFLGNRFMEAPSMSYLGEAIEPRFRGTLSSLAEFLYIAGTVYLNLIGVFFHWKTLSLLAAILPLITFFIVLTVRNAQFQLQKKIVNVPRKLCLLS